MGESLCWSCTDHKPFTTIFGHKKGAPAVAAARLQHWAMKLSAYSYQIEFRGTHEHANADALSRLPLNGEYRRSLPSTCIVQHKPD